MGKPWSEAELEALRTLYPEGGVEAVMAATGRPRQGTFVKASLLGIRVRRAAIPAPKPKLQGPDLEEAIRLHEEERWGYERIGKLFGLCETAVQNACMIELSKRAGHRPIDRDEGGNILPEGRERLRYALRLGMTGSEIAFRLAVSVSTVSRERRAYDAELRKAGKVPLPPPGKGKHYSGRKLTAAEKREVEALLMQGLGALKITQRIPGMSKTSIQRVRKRLVARLAKKGQAITGCDLKGNRIAGFVEHASFIHPKRKAKLRELLLQGVRVAPAMREAGMFRVHADRERKLLIAELAERGETLPEPKRWDSWQPVEVEAFWPPVGKSEAVRLNRLLDTMDFDEAKAAFIDEQRQKRLDQLASEKAERERPKTFEDQLAAIERGATLMRALPRNHLDTTVLRPEERPAA